MIYSTKVLKNEIKKDHKTAITWLYFDFESEESTYLQAASELLFKMYESNTEKGAGLHEESA
jgi:hypothetical protein